MQLIDQHAKRIMEGCKERARDAGLSFGNETLEYIVTNRDLLELTPKMMIPTLYDYWVHDVEVLKEKGRYEIYPDNPYETVINTRPAISFYNDNNPDWLNVMIFYHVLAHIDFFQNNLFFRNTWDYDIAGQALADKRLIARLRSEKGRWVDYIVEFARSIDNLTGYFEELARKQSEPDHKTSRLDYYFDVFLQSIKKVRTHEYLNEIQRYNDVMEKSPGAGEQYFFAEIATRYPEFETFYERSRTEKSERALDLLDYLMEHSEVLKRDENKWMLSILQVIRQTSLYFQPQLRTKIMNEGWASYWHEALFLQDDRIRGHEIDFARVHARVTSLPRVGINPYALGMRLFTYLEDLANKGRYSMAFRRLKGAAERENFDVGDGKGLDFIFSVRENFSDFSLINSFVDQDFVNQNNLFVTGRRLNRSRMVWEYYVKSRKAEDYRRMLLGALYHPPRIEINREKSVDGILYLVHRFEEKPLVKDFLSSTMLGIEFLWGGPVKLETSEVVSVTPPAQAEKEERDPEISWRRKVYTMKNRQLSSQVL